MLRQAQQQRVGPKPTKIVHEHVERTHVRIALEPAQRDDLLIQPCIAMARPNAPAVRPHMIEADTTITTQRTRASIDSPPPA